MLFHCLYFPLCCLQSGKDCSPASVFLQRSRFNLCKRSSERWLERTAGFPYADDNLHWSPCAGAGFLPHQGRSSCPLPLTRRRTKNTRLVLADQHHCSSTPRRLAAFSLVQALFLYLKLHFPWLSDVDIQSHTA